MNDFDASRETSSGADSVHQAASRAHSFGLLLFALILLGGAAFGVFLQRTHAAHLVNQQRQAEQRQFGEGPSVAYVLAQPGNGQQALSLLGEAEPYASATLYAKVSGYLSQVRFDKGDYVHKGELLAVIQSPETDSEYQAALADAQNKLSIAHRYAALVKKDMISRQQADQASSDAQVAQENVARLNTLRSYENIIAPFSGTITARYADPGALLQSATGAQTGALPVFTLAQIDRLRVYAYVGQDYADLIHHGMPVQITDPADPSHVHAGRVTRTSRALDPKTRTLLTEVDLPNPRNTLLAGSAVDVRFPLRARHVIQLPTSALILSGNKSLVGIIDAHNRLQLRPVSIAENDGVHILVVSGVQPGERVALNLTPDTANGAQVRPQPQPTPQRGQE